MAYPYYDYEYYVEVEDYEIFIVFLPMTWENIYTRLKNRKTTILHTLYNIILAILKLGNKF